MPFVTMARRQLAAAWHAEHGAEEDDDRKCAIYFQRRARGLEERLAEIKRDAEQAERTENRRQEIAQAEREGNERALERIRTGVNPGLMGRPRYDW